MERMVEKGPACGYQRKVLIVMEQVTTRKAQLSDLDILLSFEQGIIETERPFDPTLKEERINYYDLAKMLTASNVEVIVAEWEGEIIGSGYARIEDAKDYLKHSRHAFLGFMFVKPGHRGKGVNNIIMEALKQWSRSQGVHELKLEVYYDNLPAIRAYEKAGFSKRLVEMRIGLDEEAGN